MPKIPVPVSRRGLLLAGLAGVAAPVVPLSGAVAATRVTSSLAIGSLPTVKPISSQKAYEAFGICSHPNFGKTGYQYTNACMSAIATVGASYFRGLYVPEHAATPTTIRLAREKGIEWGMTVCPDLFYPISDLTSRIKHIASNAADVCLYVEGVNEPNHVRDGGKPPSDWVQRTVARQRAIWQTVKGDRRLAHVKVVGPSLHSVDATESDYRALRDAGLVQYMDFAGLHRYPGGRYPHHLLDKRIAWVNRYWAAKPVWITETGYTNALHRPAGHGPVPEDVSAAYAPSALLEAVDRGCKVLWYELLDDPDSLAKEDIESNFGMYATAFDAAPPWRAKPVVAVMKAMLAQLKDPGPAYDPPMIELKVTSEFSDVRTTVVAKRDGTRTLHVRRAVNCWDPVTRQRIPVTPVPVTVQTARSVVQLVVDHNVQSVPLV